MKRAVCVVLLLSLLSGLLAAAPAGSAELTVAAPSAVLMEKETGAVLYDKNALDTGFPASITKIMTMLLIVEAIENGVLSPDDTVTASERAASFGGSCVYLEPGERMSVREMLKCIAVVSANDCAVAMAEHLCGSEEVFVRRMNERARELGLEHTHFTNCTGLFDDGEHFTCALDVARMSRELIGHESIKEYTTIWMDSIRGGDFELVNTNKLVSRYPGCTGLKTGYTSTARYCLAATAERAGVEYIAVVMHCDTAESRNRDAEALLNYAFAGFRLIPLQGEGQTLPALPVALGKRDTVALRFDGPEKLLARKGGEPSYALSLPASVPAPVEEGARLGALRVTLGGEMLAEVPVIAAESVPHIGFGGLALRLAGSLVGL
ncbi:MAG: D-alanyl-D-alanine carboxypeptidase [Oscillospiraceae bacterium]|nr:D-alanyl-D-alanine carboxypeptidase [Oscillospiraceae bacterium]